MKYYLKKCGFQELGSVKEDGIIHRGRYLLTSMNTDILKLFPPLSKTQLNDSALLPVIPLYSGKKVYCNFVYHNDKFNGSTAVHPRNEYRLYLNKKLEDDKILFEADDVVIIRIEEIYNPDDNQIQKVYFLDLIKDRYSAYYQTYSRLIDEYPINGGYGLFDGIIPEFEAKVERLIVTNDVEVLIDDAVTTRIKQTNENTVADLFNAVTFRDFVMVGYKNLCAITGEVIRYEGYMNLEAAHIKPQSHGGFFMPNNGLALCRDLHWAFDKGFFTLNDDFQVVVHDRIQSELLNSLNGKKIRLPEDDFFKPSYDNMQYHRNNVFGLFLTSGRL